MRIFEGKNLSIDLEYNKEYAILHLPRVERLTKGDYVRAKEFLLGWHTFFETMGLMGIFAATDDEKVLKWLKKLGFNYLGEFDNLEVYQWHLQSQ